MTTLVILTVVEIVLLVGGLAVYLFIVGGQLTRIADLLEDCAELVWKIRSNAEAIEPGVEHINSTAGVTAGALPLLYGMAEGIVDGATYQPEPADKEPVPAVPAMGTRRSRLHEAVGYHPD